MSCYRRSTPGGRVDIAVSSPIQPVLWFRRGFQARNRRAKPTQLGRIHRMRDQGEASEGEGGTSEIPQQQIANVKEGRSDRTPSADAFDVNRLIDAGSDIDP